MVSELFDQDAWKEVDGFGDLTDITYHRAVDSRHGAGRVQPARGAQRVPAAHRRRAVPGARPRPDVRRRGVRAADRQRPVAEGRRLGVLLRRRSAHPRPRTATSTPSGETAETIDPARAGRLHILEVQRLIRFMPKVVICVVPGWAAGGGHSLHVVCDLTLASREHARFKQTDADVGSFDGGFGSRIPGPPGRPEVRPGDLLPGRDLHRRAGRVPDGHGQRGGAARRAGDGRRLSGPAKINAKSPTAQRMLKFAFNLIDDGLVGQQVFAGEATRLAYGTDEAVEGRDAFLEKRDPDWGPYTWY